MQWPKMCRESCPSQLVTLNKKSNKLMPILLGQRGGCMYSVVAQSTCFFLRYIKKN